MSITHHIIIQNNLRRQRNAALLLARNQPFFKDLLNQANRKAKSKTPQLAIIYAHAATELCVESAISDLFRLKGIAELEKPISSMLRSYDLNNKKLRDVFNALTKNKIQSQFFWSSFKEHTKLRHNIVHRGGTCTEAEAISSIETAKALVEYVQTTINSVRS